MVCGHYKFMGLSPEGKPHKLILTPYHQATLTITSINTSVQIAVQGLFRDRQMDGRAQNNHY